MPQLMQQKDLQSIANLFEGLAILSDASMWTNEPTIHL